MKQIELKHITPYLAYHLRCEDENGKIGVLSGIDFNGDPISFMNYTISYDWQVLPDSSSWNVYNDGNAISRIRPILRPLSDLTKEIVHNGEKFVPVERILKILGKSLDHLSDNGKVMAYDRFKTEIITKQLPCRYFEFLFEWHFDVYGLIPEGLAIDINILNKEQ